MRVLLDIQDNKAAFVLEVLKNFKFVKTTSIDDNDIILTKEQKRAIDKGIEALENGKSATNEQVMMETKKRYPNLFK